MKRLAEDLSVAEAWETELEARRLRVEESLKPPLLGLFDKLEKEELVGDQLLQEAFASGGEDVFEVLESRASRVRQLDRRALLMLVDLLLRLRLLKLNEDIGLGRVKKLAKVVVQELARPDIVWSCLDKEEVRIVMMMTQELGGVPPFLARVANQLLAGSRKRGIDIGVQTEDK